MLQIRFLLKRRLTEQKEKFLLLPILLKVEMKSIPFLLLTRLMKSIQERIDATLQYFLRFQMSQSPSKEKHVAVLTPSFPDIWRHIKVHIAEGHYLKPEAFKII
jgi:RNA binding exosome subunit